ncbi:uncharacterized protein LOC121410685 isoform X2 [Lytechinus variegatus]|uniref:uncharacterized protein LOC121410685 isoform X2 n=1 Tax=Lytechinus variegatus TaxID=7654 RepID=UPI001BB2B059|nr:uncharacterized protein LOC121410685 isoform X2 [Lytechinus variegatus]
MNNSSDRNRYLWHTLLLAVTCVVSFAVVIQAQDSSFSISFSSGDLLLPCVYRGQPHLHGDVWNVDECTACNCDNATVTCVIESCQPAFCAEPLKPEGECCFLCPYNVKVKKVLPEITSTNTIAEGGDNRISLDVPIKFQEAMDTTGVSGEDLWTLSAWASSTPDGRGPRYGYNRNVLDDIQEDQDYKKKDKFQFSDIDFRFNDPMAECEDMKYICVRIQRGAAPITTGDLEYQFSGYPDDNVLTGCTGSPECIGIAAREMDWTLEPLETVIPGERTAVSIDNTVIFKENNPLLTGDGLWRMGLFGSRNAEGTGDRFSYVSQTLSLPQQGTTLNPNLPLEFMDAETEFEMGSVGCNEYGYVCVEFTGGDDPMPSFFFRVEDAVDSSKEANTLVSCREQECLSRAIFTDLDVDLGDQVLVENKNNFLNVDLSGITADDSTNVIGDELWKVSAYASQNPEGTGSKVGLVEQILDPFTAAADLNEGEDLPMDGVDFDFDMTGLRCEDVPYLCFDLDKNPDATVNFIYESRPDEAATTTCVDFRDRCKGATAIDVDWDLEVGDGPFDEPLPLTIDADVLFEPDSPDVNGDGLWQLGVFAAKNPEGSGPRKDEVTQVLDPLDQSVPLDEGGPLPLDDVDFPFPINEVGCSDYNYLCVEFKKGEAPSPDFKFETQSGEDSIISCKEQPCRGALPFFFNILLYLF